MMIYVVFLYFELLFLYSDVCLLHHALRGDGDQHGNDEPVVFLLDVHVAVILFDHQTDALDAEASLHSNC